MNAMAGSGVGAEYTEGESPVGLTDLSEAMSVLEAEESMLSDLIDAAEKAARSHQGSVRTFIKDYWVAPLNEDKIVTQKWLKELKGGHNNSVKNAASKELEIVREFRDKIQELIEQHPNDLTLRTALESYDGDFRAEAGGKLSILNVLP